MENNNSLEMARAFASSMLPEGETARGFLLGRSKISIGWYLVFGVLALLLGESNRQYGIVFSDEVAVIIGYNKATQAYMPVSTIIVPVNKLRLERKMMYYHLFFVDERGRHRKLKIHDSGVNAQDFLIFGEILKSNGC